MAEEMPDTIRFHYIKSEQYRTIHVDGAWGGPSPSGDIGMAIFSERSPIPQILTKEVREDGSLGGEVPDSRVTKDGLVREVQATLVFNLQTALALRTWLDDKIEVMTRRMAATTEEADVDDGEGGSA